MIMRDCSDALSELDSSEYAHRYALLKRRLVLIGHWLYMLPREEQTIVQQHLIEGWTWARIASDLEKKHDVFENLKHMTRTLNGKEIHK